MKKSFVAGLCLLALGVVFFAQIRLGLLTALFLWDLLDEESVRAPDRGALAWITPAPIVKQIRIPGPGGQIPADVYCLADGKKRAAILLTHGIIEDGKDDPRLIRFARSLAHTGFVVLVPELKGMKSFRVLLSDVDDITTSFRHLASLEQVDVTRIGLLGFSYGAGPTLIAAADPSIRRQVKFLVSFGGYYDPLNVIRFITTGYYEFGDERGFLRPGPYGKWVFFMNNVDYVESEKDRRLLRTIFKKEEEEKRAEAAPLLRELTPRGKQLYELLVNEDPKQVEAIVQGVDPRVQNYLRRLSLAPVVPLIDAYLIIGHGSTDPLIPYTESLRLAAAVPDKDRVHVAILRLFDHVDPSRKSYSWSEFITVYLPSMARFYYLIYDLLSQQR